jgi:ATP-dependent helicase HrpB
MLPERHDASSIDKVLVLKPQVVAGKVPLLIHLLSPAGKPLQITQDLAGFWRSSYHDVKKEMKGR